ncbi:hypothetical protein ACNKHR_13065 [Shigella flexneri]
MPAITPVTSANGISTVITMSALADLHREWDADYWFDGANSLSELTEKEESACGAMA